MMCCGEDLGMIPACVESVIDELSILGLRIQRMPKDPKQDFEDTWKYPYMTVCSPSVHDTSTLRGWWEENYDGTQRYFAQMLGRGWIQRPPAFAEPQIISDILCLHLFSPSMWTIICLQDFFGLAYDLRINQPSDERINIPAVRHHNWKYRMHMTIDTLLRDHLSTSFFIRRLIDSSHRLD